MSDFSGQWQTSFGPMDLTQQGSRVRGTYVYMGSECTIDGKLDQGKLIFTYQEPSVSGEGWFELARYGKAFTGQFQADGSPRWENWEGERIGFDGLWNTTFGLMRLIEEPDRIQGFYEVGGNSTIAGKRKDDELVFTYQEPKTQGHGRFELAKDGLSFQGEWQAQGDATWRPWWGIRVRPRPDLTWLVVVEAPWQRFLSEQEYAFGNMLREFFARVPRVQVRHRFFTNESGLRKCCRDLLYIPEPVVLVVATHAQPDGITVDGQTIGVQSVVDSLRHAGNLRLVHFSACLLMQDPAVVDVLRNFASEARTPISGYTTSVNWAQSAIIEFTFLEMILAREMTAAAAAEQLTKLLPFAGNEPLPDAAFPPAGFTIVMPELKSTPVNGAPKAKKGRKVSR
jgi:hypothetical protein